MMSSLFSPITGKRECAVSMTKGMNCSGGVVDVDDIHLRARHHDVAHLQLGDLQHAFDHGQRVGVQQVALVGGVQQLDQLLAVFRLAHQDRAEALEQSGFGCGSIAASALAGNGVSDILA